MPTKPPKPDRSHEAELWGQGYTTVAGVDEVGRGAWAGPLVAAAVVLPQDCDLPDVRDSKLLTKTKRFAAARTIKQAAVAIGVGWATPAEVDQLGLTQALQQAGWRALAALSSVDAVLLDGQTDFLAPKYQVQTIVRGDQCCLSVAAASIIAKVARDQYMTRIHPLYPQFGFDDNVGYGTKRHQTALADGITPLHRRSYKPVRIVIDGHH